MRSEKEEEEEANDNHKNGDDHDEFRIRRWNEVDFYEHLTSFYYLQHKHEC